MNQNQTASPAAATHEPASPSTPARVPRRLRADGWTGEKQAAMLELLAACGVVATACAGVRMTPQSAYAFRRRPAGRAFGVASDAALRHRAPARVTDEMLGRAMHGVTDTTRDREGNAVRERHRHDNRMLMCVAARLDRIAAEPLADADARMLRAVSNDFDDLLDCIEDGGDANAFVDARRPSPPPAAKPVLMDEADLFAKATGHLRYKFMNPNDIDLSDLVDTRRGEYSGDQLMRAHYSGLWVFEDICAAERREAEDDPDYDGDPDEDFDDSVDAFIRQRALSHSRFLRRKAEAALSARKAALRNGTSVDAVAAADVAAKDRAANDRAANDDLSAHSPQPSTSST